MKPITSLKTIPLWKWILLLVGFFLLTVVAYGLSNSIWLLSKNPYLLTVMYLLAAVLLTAIYWGMVRLFTKRKVKEIRPTIGLANGFVFGFLFIFLVTLILYFLGCYRVESINFNFSVILMFLAQFLMVGCGEEIVFRGVLFRFVDERWGLWPALIVSAIFFGGVHLPNPGATFLSAVFLAIETGLLFAIAYKFTGNLWFPIGIHWGWNFTLGPVLGYSVSGIGFKGTIVTPIVSGPEILTGGNFGPENTIIAATLSLLVFLLLLWRYQRKD